MFTQKDLRVVTEGMQVYDKDGHQIGTVKDFRFGEGTRKTAETDIVTIAEVISEVLGGRKNLPTVLYSRLYSEGFIWVNRGFLRSDAIVFPNQVNEIGADRIYLNVDQDMIMKL